MGRIIIPMMTSSMGHKRQMMLHLNSKISNLANKATTPTHRRTMPKNKFLFFMTFCL